MEPLRVPTGLPCVFRHRVLVHPDQPCRSARPAAFGQVLQERDCLVDRKLQPLDRSTATLREHAATGPAVDHPNGALVPAPTAEAEVPEASPPAIRAAIDLTAEVFYEMLTGMVVDVRLRSRKRAHCTPPVTSSAGQAEKL
jgi:hypothetical protein